MSIFQHGVASGDPLQDRVILWTRLSVSSAHQIGVVWEVALDPAFHNVISTGETFTSAERDYTIHADAVDLSPGTRYFYRFRAAGELSPTGRTKTLPAKDASHVRFVQTSCAKFNAGYFNAYARMAERDDVDFVLHLGDYIYEAADTPPAGQTPGANIGRAFRPLHECKRLDDYRVRYAQYRSDPDVQVMHAAHPIIATVDDHEFADGAWRGGADVHDELRDGPWAERLTACFRARSEWLPVRLPDPADPHRVYQSIRLGDLADLFLINTRSYRDQPVPPPKMHDSARTALGPDQRAWLFAEFEKSQTAWRLLGNPSVLATTWRADLSDETKLALLKTKLIAADGNGPDYDQWDGYPAERARMFELFRNHKLGNIVVLSGDIHTGMAIELAEDPFGPDAVPIAVEFINSSLTSQNLDDKMKWGYRTESLEYERRISTALPHIKWCDLDSHGYNIVDVRPERIRVEYWMVDTVLTRTRNEQLGAEWEVRSGKPEAIRIH